MLQHLIDNGFIHYPEWDFKEVDSPGYRLDLNGVTYRARVVDCNGPEYICLGVVVRGGGIVDRWRDVCSLASLKSHIYGEESYSRRRA